MKERRLLLAFLMGMLLVLAVALGTATGSPAILRVKPSAGGTGDCSSWANACTLQHALKYVASYSDEVWVMTGVYTPTTTGTDRTATFQLVSGVELYGGFVGTETSHGQRDWESNITVLSGDIDDNDITDPNGVITATSNINGSNSYHVVTSSAVTETCVLDGFTVTGGSGYRGGGMYNGDSSPTLANLTFSGNFAWEEGGGMNNDHSSPTLTDVTFSANSAEHGGGGMSNIFSSSPTLANGTFTANTAEYGGGMYNSDSSSPTLSNVTFSGNSASDSCGGMSNSWGSSPTLSDVTFSSNSAGSHGGGVCNSSGSATFINVSFTGNTAEYGGGMDNASGSPALTNVTFSGNRADYDGGGMTNYYSSARLSHVAFTGNSAGRNGGGMHNVESSPQLTDVTFTSNSTDYAYGGGVYNYKGSATFINVIFTGNSADWNGGGMYNWLNSPTLTNVTFSGNSATVGGGVDNDYSSPTLTNVSFSGNSATFQCGGVRSMDSTTILANAILWGNTSPSDAQICHGTGALTITHSLVQDSGGSGAGWDSSLGTDGGGNLDADPQFADADGADDIVGTVDDDLHLGATSPAINAGDSAAVPADTLDLDGDSNTTEPLPFDLDGYPRIVGAAVDMGPYEWPVFLTVGKTVINDDGGTASAADFQAHIQGNPVPWNVAQSVMSGTYTISETVEAGYSASAWSGDCAPDGTITLTIGDAKTCSITNDDIAPTLTLTKTVVNDDDGAATVSDFQAYLDGDPVPWGVPQSVMPGTHSVSESVLLGYVPTMWGGDCSGDGTITIELGENAVCSITNDDMLRTCVPLVLKRYAP